MQGRNAPIRAERTGHSGSNVAVGPTSPQARADGKAPTAEATAPGDVLHPPASLQARLALRIARETGTEPLAVPPLAAGWSEPAWEQVAPGINCKVLANDTVRRRVSMLVRLAPGASYPPHTHAGIEELHLLHGELWVDERKLAPGDYNCGQPGASDDHVWSATGCTCLLVTSTDDVLR